MTPPSHLPLAPGPSFTALVRRLPLLRSDRIRFFWELWKEYGDVVRFDVFGRRIHLLTNPEHLQYVLEKNWRNYRKADSFNRERQVVLGDSLLTMHGPAWHARRRLAQPAFGRKELDGLVAVMSEVADRTFDTWAPLAGRAEPFDLAAELTGLTIAVAGGTLFGVDLGEDAPAIRQAFGFIVEEASRRMASLVRTPLWIPSPRNLRYRRMIRVLDRIVYRIIEAGRHQERTGSDVLSRLLAARDEETGLGMSDLDLRNEVMTFLVAGHESTASSLAWTTWLVATHPAVEERLRAEVAEVLGDRLPRADDLPRLEYTRWTIEESLRLYPPSWLFDRYAIEDDAVGGYRIPAGSELVFLPWIQHRLPSCWDEPEAFRPERFAPGADEGRPTYAYCPFGGGPRTCIGNRFALLESQVILARFLQRYRVEIVPGHPIEPFTLIALRPKHGVLARLAVAGGRT